MTLMTSGLATGRRCPVCGSPDGACGGAHASNEPTPVDAPIYAKGTRPMPVDAVIRKTINGQTADVLGTIAEAEAEGLEVVRRLDGKPYHKKRPKPEPPAPVEPDTESGDADEDEDTPENSARGDYLASLTKPALYDLAKDLDIDGRSNMGRDELIAAILEAEAATA